jgi:hypothetical protein
MQYGKQLPVSHFPVISFLGFILICYYLVALYLLFYGSFDCNILNSWRTDRDFSLITEQVYLIKGDLVALFAFYPVNYYIFLLLDLILFSASCNYRVNLGLLDIKPKLVIKITN